MTLSSKTIGTKNAEVIQTGEVHANSHICPQPSGQIILPHSQPLLTHLFQASFCAGEQGNKRAVH